MGMNAFIMVVATMVSATSPEEDAARLPAVLRLENGTPVTTPQDWALRREEMTSILLKYQYGHLPPWPDFMVEEAATEQVVVEGLPGEATRLRATLVFGPEKCLRMPVCCWLPPDANAPSPAVLAIEPVWWPDPFLRNGIVERVLSRGYAFAGFDHNALASYEDPDIRAALDAYPEQDWGVVAAAAWGASITLTWVGQLSHVNGEKVGIWGHSRRGKSALLAGALDPRFAVVVPHMSGMAGSAAYRVRGQGAQELEQLLERYWLIPRAFDYIDREDALPFDQHWLLALVAPRPLYLHVGLEDHWGNPRGEKASCTAARKVYQWMGHEKRLGIYCVDGGHGDPNGPDGGESWEVLLDFLDVQFHGRPVGRRFDSLTPAAVPGPLGE